MVVIFLIVLVGGETAEMPELILKINRYSRVCSSVVDKENIIKKIK